MSDLIETWRNDFKAFVNSLNLSRDDYKTMMEYIDEIPAVQPDHNADVSKKVSISCGQENDLISRQAALDAVGDWIYNPEDLRYHKDVINSIPTIQPEIIRCKDCKWCEDADGLMCKNTASWVVATDYDFGCVCAERREDG